MTVMVPYRSNRAHRMVRARFSTEGSRRALRGLNGCGCSGACGCHGFGALGQTTTTGLIASRGAGLLASQAVVSTAGTAAITGALTAMGVGAAAGSVVPIVGTVVGAVVGLLSAGLFGKANQAQIQADVLNRMKMADAYKLLAGQFPGRMYGLNDLLMVWYGLLHEDYFPQAEACSGAVLDASLCPPQYPNCACGAETWANGMMNGNDVYEFRPLISHANAAGVTNPSDVVSQYLIPGMESLSDSEKNAHWALPSNSIDAGLVTQLYIDIVDAIEAAGNSSLPVTYGTGIEPAAPAPAAPATAAPASAPAPAAAPAPAPIPAAPPPTYSQIGASITPESGEALVTPAGTFTFGAQMDTAGDCAVLIDGASYGQFGVALTFAPGSVVVLTRADGSQWQQISLNGWEQVRQATNAVAAATAPATTQSASSAAPPAATAGTNAAGIPAAIAAEYQAIGEDSSGNTVYEDSKGAVWEWNGSQMVPFTGTSLAQSYLTPPGTYVEVATDPNGNPVYADSSANLYQWNGWKMVAFSGLLQGGHTGTQLTQQLLVWLAQGMPMSEADQEVIASWGGAVTMPASVQNPTYNAPAPIDTEAYYTGASAGAPVAASTSSSSGKTLLLVGGAVGIGLLALAFSGGGSKRRH
jgi:hypothetical protein